MTDDIKNVSSPGELTSEQVAEHLADETWGDALEILFHKMLEKSDAESLRVAYALNSMFVQTSHMALTFGQLQVDLKELYDHSTSIRNALYRKDGMDPSLIAYDEWMSGTHDKVKNG